MSSDLVASTCICSAILLAPICVLRQGLLPAPGAPHLAKLAGSSLCLAALRLQVPGFLRGCWGSNSVPHAFKADTVSQPHSDEYSIGLYSFLCPQHCPSGFPGATFQIGLRLLLGNSTKKTNYLEKKHIEKENYKTEKYWGLLLEKLPEPEASLFTLLSL